MAYESRTSKISQFTAGTPSSSDMIDFIQSGINKRGTIQQIIDLVASVYGASLRTYEFESELVADDIALGEYAIVEENNYSFYKITNIAAGGSNIALDSGLTAEFEIKLKQENVHDSVADLIASSPSTDSGRVIGYYGGWAATVDGPKGGFSWHKTGGTNTSPTVGTAVSAGSIGGGDGTGDTTGQSVQAGYFWTADGAECCISSGYISVWSLGPVGDGVADDFYAIRDSITVLARDGFFSLEISGGTFLAGSELSANITDKKIFGSGAVVNNGSGNNVFSLVGDGNLIEGIAIESTGNQQSQDRILYVIGDRNTISRVSVGWQTFLNPVSEGQQYGSQGIELEGDENIVDGCSTTNTNQGISDSGIGNRIINNTIFNTCTGIRVSNLSRRGVVYGNNIDCQSGGIGLQGCDGIWGARNHRFTSITDNKILSAGEHGMYLQGDSFNVSGNFVSNCSRDGIKVGGKVDGNYWYPGETVRELAANGDYTSFDAVISSNNCEGNQTVGGTGAEIYLQSNVRDCIISNNTCRFGGAYGIRSVVSAIVNVDEVMQGITVVNNKIHSTAESSISIVALEDLIIEGNECDGAIAVSSRQASEPTERSSVRGNICQAINIIRQDDCLVDSNESGSLTVSSNSCRLHDNKFYNQELGDFNSRVSTMEGNEFYYNGSGAVAEIEGCEFIVNNKFIFNESTETYALQGVFNGSTPLRGSFSGNTVYVPNSQRPLRIGGSNGVISNNILTNDGTDTTVISCFAKNCSVNGNVCNTGSIVLESASTNTVATGNGIKVSDSGTSNIVANNRI